MAKITHRYQGGMQVLTDGVHTGYGSSRRLAERALQEAKKTNRKSIQYTVDPNDDMFCIWNHYGDKVERPSENKNSGGGCFLTTACVRARGLDDDCRELQVLRDFRDNWLIAQPWGKQVIIEYYRVAPKLVEQTENRPDSESIIERLYEAMVSPCVALINQGEHEKAFRLYAFEVVTLKRKIGHNRCR